jgi:serine/threonine-protein kinase RsbW
MVTRPVRVRLVLPRTPRAELLATQAVEKAGQRIAFPRDTLAEVKLAVVEACLNAFEYGSGEVEVEVVAHPDNAHAWIEVAVVDHGPGFDPAGVARPVLEDKLRSDRKRGWGLELIRRLMDEVEITSQPGLTTVRMIRRRGGE